MSNENFWTDERVIEFEIFKRGSNIRRSPKEESISDLIEQFKASKQVKEWEVTHYLVHQTTGWNVVEARVALGCIGTKIHSVKRLSDGEIFSVGDWVCDGSLEMQIGSIVVGKENCVLQGNICRVNIVYAKKKRTSILTGADSKPIYKNDIFFGVVVGNIPYPPFSILDFAEGDKEDITPAIAKQLFEKLTNIAKSKL